MAVNLGFAVAGDNAFYIAHTAVAQLYSVAVEDFVQWVRLREMLVNSLEEAFADFCFNSLAVWRIEPQDVSLAALVLS